MVTQHDAINWQHHFESFMRSSLPNHIMFHPCLVVWKETIKSMDKLFSEGHREGNFNLLSLHIQ